MEHEIEVTIRWENGVGFEIVEKANGGPTITIIKAEEDAEHNLGVFWNKYTAVCSEYFKVFFKRVGEDMSKTNG